MSTIQIYPPNRRNTRTTAVQVLSGDVFKCISERTHIGVYRHDKNGKMTINYVTILSGEVIFVLGHVEPPEIFNRPIQNINTSTFLKGNEILAVFCNGMIGYTPIYFLGEYVKINRPM